MDELISAESNVGELEVRGRARREAAGAASPSGKLSNRNSSRSNGSWRMTT